MSYTLTPDQLDEFGKEMDALRQRVIADLGEDDADYIRGVVKAQRAFEGAGRALFYLPPAWPLAVASLSISKILDNMEIGHNVMHGQYDWMGDPALNSRMYEWDTSARASSGSTPTTTSTTPTRTSSARTATSATASCGWTRTRSGSRTTSATRSTRSC